MFWAESRDLECRFLPSARKYLHSHLFLFPFKAGHNTTVGVYLKSLTKHGCRRGPSNQPPHVESVWLSLAFPLPCRKWLARGTIGGLSDPYCPRGFTHAPKFRHAAPPRRLDDREEQGIRSSIFRASLNRIKPSLLEQPHASGQRRADHFRPEYRPCKD